jgi:hypothetical protein
MEDDCGGVEKKLKTKIFFFWSILSLWHFDERPPDKK